MLVCPSVCLPSAWNKSTCTGRIFMTFDTWEFFENLLRKFKFHQTLRRITGTLREELYTFVISRWIVCRMTNISDENCGENKNTHFVINLFWKSFRLWDNVEKYVRLRLATDDNIIRLMCFARWITKARIQTHTQKTTEEKFDDIHVCNLSPIFHDSCVINAGYIRLRMYRFVKLKHWKLSKSKVFYFSYDHRNLCYFLVIDLVIINTRRCLQTLKCCRLKPGRHMSYFLIRSNWREMYIR
jgi:hypothetical protein